MRAKLGEVRKKGTVTLKTMWYVLAVSCVVQIIVSCATAAVNSTTPAGYKSGSFAALWAMFLALIFQGLSYTLVFRQQSSALYVGFMIGTGFMVSELFFMLMCVFFVLASEAATHNPTAQPADNAYGSFAFFNTILYFAWSVILTFNRENVTQPGLEHGQEDEGDQSKDMTVDDAEGTHNPYADSNPYADDSNAL